MTSSIFDINTTIDNYSIIGPGLKVIGTDEEVLNYAEMFELRGTLEKHLAKREEVTHVVNHVSDNGSQWLYVFCVHTLVGDSGFVLTICDKSDKDAYAFASDMLKLRLETAGVAKYHEVALQPNAADA